MKEKRTKSSKHNVMFKKIGLPIIGIIAGLLVLASGYFGYLYASTPSHFRSPEFEHYHLRTQIIVDGEPVNFSQDKFQEDYDATSCSTELTGQPIDFHDKQDQLAPVHWRGVTGGEFLKFYGWNLIGGKDDSLGYRYDQGIMNMHQVKTSGNLLPALPENTNFYVYVGEKDNYIKKDWQKFLKEDLEVFLDKKSNLNREDKTTFNILDIFGNKAYAHGVVKDGHESEGEPDKEKLERINNLIGNVVIFVQKDEPTDKQIKERFNNLVPLKNSVCGG